MQRSDWLVLGAVMVGMTCLWALLYVAIVRGWLG